MPKIVISPMIFFSLVLLSFQGAKNLKINLRPVAASISLEMVSSTHLSIPADEPGYWKHKSTLIVKVAVFTSIPNHTLPPYVFLSHLITYPLCASLCLCLPVCMSLFLLFICLSLFLFCVPVCLSVCLSFCLPVSVFHSKRDAVALSVERATPDEEVLGLIK